MISYRRQPLATSGNGGASAQGAPADARATRELYDRLAASHALQNAPGAADAAKLSLAPAPHHDTLFGAENISAYLFPPPKDDRVARTNLRRVYRWANKYRGRMGFFRQGGVLCMSKATYSAWRASSLEGGRS